MSLPVALALGLLAHQGVVSYLGVRERNARYAEARGYADSVGKPLLVVGGPFGDNPFRFLFSHPAHGYGDVCVDIDPRACQGNGGSQFVQADVRDLPFPDGYFAGAYVSHVIEHLPSVAEAERALAELHRVADRVWLVSPSKQSLIAQFFPGHRLWVSEQDGELVLEQRMRSI